MSHLLKLQEKDIEVGFSPNDIKGISYEQAKNIITEAGFSKIKSVVIDDLDGDDLSKEGIVEKVTIQGIDDFNSDSIYSNKSEIVLTYHITGNIAIGINSKNILETDYQELEKVLRNTGFVNVVIIPKEDLTFGILKKENMISEVIVDGLNEFDEFLEVRPDAKIEIYYHSFKDKK